MLILTLASSDFVISMTFLTLQVCWNLKAIHCMLNPVCNCLSFGNSRYINQWGIALPRLLFQIENIISPLLLMFVFFLFSSPTWFHSHCLFILLFKLHSSESSSTTSVLTLFFSPLLSCSVGSLHPYIRPQPFILHFS